jgi:hypothetical protein
MSKFHHKIDKKYGLVNAVRVEPVAAAMSFAWNTSMQVVVVGKRKRV